MYDEVSKNEIDFQGHGLILCPQDHCGSARALKTDVYPRKRGLRSLPWERNKRWDGAEPEASMATTLGGSLSWLLGTAEQRSPSYSMVLYLHWIDSTLLESQCPRSGCACASSSTGSRNYPSWSFKQQGPVAIAHKSWPHLPRPACVCLLSFARMAA